MGVRGISGGVPTLASGSIALASGGVVAGCALAGCRPGVTVNPIGGDMSGTLAGGVLADGVCVCLVNALAGGAVAGDWLVCVAGPRDFVLEVGRNPRDRTFQVRGAITSFMMMFACSNAVVDMVDVGTWASVHPCTHLPVI